MSNAGLPNVDTFYYMIFFKITLLLSSLISLKVFKHWEALNLLWGIQVFQNSYFSLKAQIFSVATNVINYFYLK